MSNDPSYQSPSDHSLVQVDGHLIEALALNGKSEDVVGKAIVKILSLSW